MRTRNQDLQIHRKKDHPGGWSVGVREGFDYHGIPGLPENFDVEFRWWVVPVKGRVTISFGKSRAWELTWGAWPRPSGWVYYTHHSLVATGEG